MLLRNFELAGFAPGTLCADTVCAGGATGWLNVDVPQDVHTALLVHGLLKDPRYFANDEKAVWVEQYTWVYRTTIFCTAVQPRTQNILFCEGLDTYCVVYVNGLSAGRTENMLVPHTLDITALLHSGDNELAFIFLPMPEQAARSLPDGFWINYSTERAWARKAAFGYGWDWCARLATIGIWRPIHLIERCSPVLENVFFAVITASPDAAEIDCTASVVTPEITDLDGLSAEFSLLEGEHVAVAVRADVKNGTFQTHLLLNSPRLWWTWDLGEPFLYTARTVLYCGSKVLDTREFSFGVRTVQVNTTDKDGRSVFQFCLNGVPVYGRGANWVPVDNLLTLPGREERYKILLHLARDANMNMLCLWGGGIYEDDLFYACCDKLGILIWQYFMFACGEYPDFNRGFLQAVHTEVEKAVIRLRNHACIALWVGNVESEMLCRKIGLNRPMNGLRLFEQYIPSWLTELDPTRLYWPSSPFGGPEPNCAEAGDRHNWDVWFKDIPYTDYRLDNCRFASEFGVHAAPALETAARWLPAAELQQNSFGWDYFNKDAAGPAHMEALLRLHTGMPETLEQAVDFSMLVQADALQCAVEHYRRNMPLNAGALVWQLNDSWPCHSWSVIDYDLIPKAAYYALRRAFAPISVLLYPLNEDQTEICVSNTTSSAFSGNVNVSVSSVLGTCVHAETLHAQIPPYSCICLKILRVGGRFTPNIILPNRRRWYYICAKIPEIPCTETFRYFSEYKDSVLPSCTISCKSSYSPDGALHLTLCTDAFARQTRIEGDMRGLSLSDNYFDMNAGVEYQVTLHALRGAPPEKRSLSIRALNAARIPLPVIHFEN